MRITRRFNAGSGIPFVRVPKGRLRGAPLLPGVQSSLRDLDHLAHNPGVETPGYCQSSRRDEGASGIHPTAQEHSQ
jgi:hypothetical protein